jgi:octaprenyl-diphosphate synthase
MLAAELKAFAIPDATTPTLDLALAWKQIAEPVDPFLQSVARRLDEQVSEFEPGIADYARYALTNQGKQLRPVLVALSGSAAGRMGDTHVTVAVIIEMVHLATLVHDDVMDGAKTRRRRPTLAANWGNEISVLLGDCLFAHALKLAASFPTPDICRAVSAATNTVCTGEILQTQRRGDFELSRAEYFRMVTMKTAELFALSCELGAFLGQGEGVEQTALRQYGMALGTAYQLYDDCLDLFGNETRAGKSLGTDLAKGKLTLPMLIAWERADAAGKRALKQRVDKWDPGHLPAVRAELLRHGALDESRGAIHQHLDAARQALSILPESGSKSALTRLTGFLAQQTDGLGVGI